MISEDFIAWSLEPARSIDERYTIELLVEQGIRWYNSRHKIHEYEPFEVTMERSRERKYNPAYSPAFTEDGLRKTKESLVEIKSWSGDSNRPVRSLAPLRFFQTLESIDLPFDEPEDLSPLADLPALRRLALGHPGSSHGNKSCADYSPLARCPALRELSLSFNVRWPDLSALLALGQLEILTLSGNLLAMPPGAVFPKVRQGALYCLPLPARSLRELPQLPACEFFTLCGAERLDGIDAMPRLRNLTLRGAFDSFAPLKALNDLTCLTVSPDPSHHTEGQPRDVRPLAALPNLRYFKIGRPYDGLDMPRDYSPLAEAPALRELVVEGCPAVEMEVAAIQAGLAPWDEVFLAAEPRPLAPLRMIVAPGSLAPHWREENRTAASELPDAGVQGCESRWVKGFANEWISRALRDADWGTVDARGRGLDVVVESIAMVERLAEIIDATRGVMACLRNGYTAHVSIHLMARAPEPSPAQKQLDEQFREDQDRWEYEQRLRDRTAYLERLHQLDLKKQLGAPINPAEFSPKETDPYPEYPRAEEDDSGSGDEGDSKDDGEGGIAVAHDPDPPAPLLDYDEHPLANNYRCDAWVTLEEAWFSLNNRALAIHLMGRKPDADIPERDDAEG